MLHPVLRSLRPPTIRRTSAGIVWYQTLFQEDTGVLEKRRALHRKRENLTAGLAELKCVH